jgi:hypothetical protein
VIVALAMTAPVGSVNVPERLPLAAAHRAMGKQIVARLVPMLRRTRDIALFIRYMTTRPSLNAVHCISVRKTGSDAHVFSIVKDWRTS